MITGMNYSAIHTKDHRRFYVEFWLICIIVGLGFVQGISIGFYSFRLIDLVFILSAGYFLKLLSSGKIEIKIRRAAIVLITFLIVRTLYDFDRSFDTLRLRTLFGMSITFLTPIVFFVVRGSSIDGKTAVRILAVACIISLLSQLGLLAWGESTVSGTVDLSGILNISSGRIDSLGYQERTITLWRALSVGITFAVLFVKTKIWIKLIGVVGLLLQTAGGGSGGRGALVFLALTPIIILLWNRRPHQTGLVRKLVLGVVLGTIFAVVYLRAPLGSQFMDEAKTSKFSYTHAERASEIFVLFTEGWGAASERGGFNARTISYTRYIEAIFSDLGIFVWGVGFYHGAAVPDTPNVQAHNSLLDTWALSGIIGVLIFIMIQVFVVSDLNRLMKAEATSGKQKLVAISFAIAILYFYQPLLFQAVSSDRSFMIVFYLLAGSVKPISIWIQEGNHQQKLSTVTE